MTNYLRSGLIIFALGTGLFACGGSDDEPDFKTPEQIAVENLAGEGSITWTLAGDGSVTKDGDNHTDTFRDFTILFNAANQSRTYTTANHNGIFDLSGNWSVTGNNLDKVVLTGDQPAAGREIQYTRNGEQLTLVFTISPPEARTTAVAGNYVFDLRRAE
jgi:hypothetical protein